MVRNNLILLTMISLFSCKAGKDLSTVDAVNINKYAGCWYEIARLPNSFEKGLECITATYTVKDNGTIEVLNQGHLSKNISKIKRIKGSAWVPNSTYPGRLKVRFFWPFSGDYYIVSLDKDYQYALVGSPSRKYLWVLSKNKELDHAIYSELLEIANNKGFNVEKIIKVNQTCK